MMWWCTDILVLAVPVLFIVVLKVLDKDPPPIFHVYRRPNGVYWVKVAFMYGLLSLRKLKIKMKKAVGRLPPVDVAALDTHQEFSSHKKAIDAAYFNAANGDGEHLVVGTARRKDGLVDGFLYLLLNDPELGVLETPKLPGTSVYQDEEKKEFGAEGIRVWPVVPMKKWRIQYEGRMKQHSDRGNMVVVKIEAEWTSELPFLNFDTDMDDLAVAKGMALEKWSREYFDTVQKVHQTHYEQFGTLEGTAVINGVSHPFKMDAVRDHSFGTFREWRHFHRYALHFISVENGDRIHVGNISMPVCFSSLFIGYIYSAEERKTYPIQSCDLQLYQHGENGSPPLDYAFQFKAGGKTYTVQVNVVHSPHFYISKDWESKVFEGLCKFSVNGRRGWGAAELAYSNMDGKNVPDYYESIKINLPA